jgi:hypothetical protein
MRGERGYRIGVCEIGEQQARLRVAENRQQALELLCLGGLRRIHRHCGDARVQAAQKRNRVVEAGRKQQHRPVAGRRLGE